MPARAVDQQCHDRRVGQARDRIDLFLDVFDRQDLPAGGTCAAHQHLVEARRVAGLGRRQGCGFDHGHRLFDRSIARAALHAS